MCNCFSSSKFTDRRLRTAVLHEAVESSTPDNTTLLQAVMSSLFWCAAVRDEDILRGDHFRSDTELTNTDEYSEQCMKVASNWSTLEQQSVLTTTAGRTDQPASKMTLSTLSCRSHPEEDSVSKGAVF